MTKPNTTTVKAALLNKPNPILDLDIKVGIQDIVDIRINEVVDTLIDEQKVIAAEKTALGTQHGQLVDELEKLGDALATDRGLPDLILAEQCAQTLTQFTGNGHYVDKAEDRSVTTDIDKRIVLFAVDIRGKSPRYREGATDIYITSRTVTLPFTAAMSSIVSQMETTAAAMNGCDARLAAAREKLADVPRLGRRAKDMLTKAYLSGQLRDTSKLLDTVMAAGTKLLPHKN